MTAAKLTSRFALLGFLLLVGSTDTVSLWNQTTQAQVYVGDYDGCYAEYLQITEVCGCGQQGHRAYNFSYNSCTGEYVAYAEFCAFDWACTTPTDPQTPAPTPHDPGGCAPWGAACVPGGSSASGAPCCSGLSCQNYPDVGYACGY